MADEQPAANLALAAVRKITDDEPEHVTAFEASQALTLALHAAGIELPGLEVDACTCGRMTHVQKLQLGTIQARTALRLAEVIAKGATA